jgi:hypothetical protein
MKIVSLFLLLFSSLFATFFDFKESRYYSALDFERVSHGRVEIKKDETVIEYVKPIAEKIVLKQDSAYVVKNGERSPITNSDTLLFLKIFEKLIKDEDMDRFFIVEEDRLLPKGTLLSNFISYIKKDRKIVEIYLKNGDWILFERD